jgi:hypothetical protein
VLMASFQAPMPAGGYFPPGEPPRR